MKRSTIPIFLLLPCLALLTGCGGKYHGSSTSNPSVSPFAGPYTGTYDAAFLDDSGTFSLVVSDGGSVSGTGTSDNAGVGTLSGGSISNSGVFSGKLTFSSNGTSADLSGRLTEQPNGNLTGTLNEVYHSGGGDVTGTVVVTLTPDND